MSSPTALQGLGLTVRETDGGLRVELPLGAGALLHPVSGGAIEQVTFAVDGRALIPVGPSALCGLGAFAIPEIADAEALADQVRERFGRQLSLLGQLAGQLDALGLVGEVDPDTLTLSAKVQAAPFTFQLQADRDGRLRVVRAMKDEAPVRLQQDAVFGLDGFGDRATLGHYLTGLLDGANAEAPSQVPVVRYGELQAAFGAAALVPPSTPLELLVELSVEGRRYRFAAGRVMGRTFRGLLAGRRGKLWAERFELDDFPGVAALAADVLGVPLDAVTILGGAEED